MRRFSLLVLFFFSASLIGWAQGRSGSGASSSSSSSSGSAASSHSSGSSGGSSSHSAGGSSGASHSSAGSRSSAGSSSHASHASNAASDAGRDGSTPSRSRGGSSENLNSKPHESIPAKVDGQGPTTKPHNWLTRFFTRNRQRPELAKAPKPCVGKNCPPPPPQPCKGQKCPPPPPPACGPGTVSNGHGGCVATYNARNDVCTTNPQAPGCLPSQGQNLHDNCAFEQSQLQRAILDRDQLLQAMNIACTADLKGAECVSLTQKHSAAESKVELMRQQLNACRF